ncbi:MAG: hypothetical protein EOP45_15940 [Sphingobacteriaceae bacterium]|nr:MAG: hypothetical protein EOP45_15940 [Sphingobacteriaceae bacterium]
MSKCAVLILSISLFFISCKKDDVKNDVGSVATVANPTEGQIVLSTYGTTTSPSLLLILDKSGNTVFKKTVSVAAYNFKKWQVNGKTRYTYIEFDSTAFKITTTGSINAGTGVVLNESFQEIKRLRLLPFNGRSASDPTGIDSHEFLYLDDNHFITLSYFQKPVNNIPASLNPLSNCLVVAPIVQEILNDKVVFEWDGTQYPEFYQQSVESNAFSDPKVIHDYMHMNSIIVDPTDNNLICSLRHLNQIIKISRVDGHIIWRLGGTNSTFPMTAATKFLRQHNATLTDNNRTLLMIDNGDAKERPFTRIMEFHFNANQTSIDSSSVFTLPMNTFVQYTGSVQKKGDTYFVSCGGTLKLMEVNYKTSQISFLMNLTNACYRAYKD